MIFTKIFLTLVGLLYAALAIWCSVAPQTTSGKVGFELKPGTGESEFLTIYGGLEMGLALVLLLPLVRNEFLFNSLLACLLIHACLVTFRTIGFFLYSDLSRMTYLLAAGEWIILLVSIACLFVVKNGLPVAPIE